MGIERRFSRSQLEPVTDAAWGTSTPVVPSETDALLAQVPRINEEADDIVREGVMFSEELRILLKYTAPIFGWVVCHPRP